MRSDGTGDFVSIQAALDSFPAGDPRKNSLVILVIEGLFHERVHVYSNFTGGVHFIGGGFGPESAVVSYNESGASSGTFNSWTCLVDADDFVAEKITFVNNAGDYNKKVAGQSVALSITGDRASILSCSILGAQDTLYTGPFRVYVGNSFINGSCDSVFGLGSAVFEKCEVTIYDTVTAQRGNGTSAYLFLNSSIVPAQSGTLLGRPWGPLARTVFSQCYLGAGISREGWGDWEHGCTNHTSTWCQDVLYGEFSSRGPGAAPTGQGRVWWSRQLNASEGASWTVERVLGGWNPPLRARLGGGWIAQK